MKVNEVTATLQYNCDKWQRIYITASMLCSQMDQLSCQSMLCHSKIVFLIPMELLVNLQGLSTHIRAISLQQFCLAFGCTGLEKKNIIWIQLWMFEKAYLGKIRFFFLAFEINFQRRGSGKLIHHISWCFLVWQQGVIDKSRKALKRKIEKCHHNTKPHL